MNPARWLRLQALFHRAADLPESARAAFLRGECHDDPALVDEVLALLEEDAQPVPVMDRGLAAVAGDILEPVPRALQDQSFGPYRIVRVLGEGGMGVVYLAQRADLGSQAALKILRDASLSPSRRERFALEQRTLAQLSHPNIAQLYDADSLPDGTPWFVMEYVEGLPLTAYCAEHATSLRGRLQLFRSVCEAVQHAHRHAVIHRDLKPSNVLVKEDGTVKLLDFGIAKQLDSLDPATEQTRTGLRLMTPAYAAPEQMRAGRIGTYTDVYALGVMLYELLAGRLPFDLTELTSAEAAQVIAEREPERPSIMARAAERAGGRTPRFGGLRRAAWTDLDVLCLLAMHKDPLRRYRTVDALIRDIDHYLAGEPLDARPDTVRYRLGKFLRRNSRPVAGAAAMLLALLTLVGFYTVRLAAARDAALEESARTQRIQRFMVNLFQGGEEEVGPADSLRVVTLIDRGLQEARALDREPAVQAELYQTLGRIYQQLGRLPRADSLLRSALEQRRALFGADHPEVAQSLVALGLLRNQQADFQEAEQLVRDGLAMVQRHRPLEHPYVVEAVTALGQVLEERGRYDEAIALLEPQVGRLAAGGLDSPELARAMYGLANNHFYAGHYEVADSLTRRVLAMSTRLYGADHPLVAEDLINLGAIQHDQGHYPEAEQYYRRALDVAQAWYGPEHYRTASILTMLARTLHFQQRTDEAATLLRQSLAIQERVFGPNHPRVASALNEVGSVALAEGRYDEAEAAFSRMAAIYRQVHGPENTFVGVAISNVGSVEMARQRWPRAERRFREALAIYAVALPPDHLTTGIARIKLGRTLLRQGRFAAAAAESGAGYEIVAKQADPGVSWLRAARTDLVAAYDSLGQSERAARYRAELEAAAAPARASGS